MPYLTYDLLSALLDPTTFVGRAPEQTRKFLEVDVAKALGDEELKAVLQGSVMKKAELSV